MSNNQKKNWHSHDSPSSSLTNVEQTKNRHREIYTPTSVVIRRNYAQVLQPVRKNTLCYAIWWMANTPGTWYDWDWRVLLSFFVITFSYFSLFQLPFVLECHIYFKSLISSNNSSCNDILSLTCCSFCLLPRLFRCLVTRRDDLGRRLLSISVIFLPVILLSIFTSWSPIGECSSGAFEIIAKLILFDFALLYEVCIQFGGSQLLRR